MADLLSCVKTHTEVCAHVRWGTRAEQYVCGSATRNILTRCGVMQKFAAHYTSCVFLKFFGNANENTKYLFRDRLQTPLTPTFSFWRRGKRFTALASRPLKLAARLASYQPNHAQSTHM